MSKKEIKSLALDDLDIEELDRRIELAPATGGGGSNSSDWPCSTNCGVDCPQVCDQYYICGANILKQQ